MLPFTSLESCECHLTKALQYFLNVLASSSYCNMKQNYRLEGRLEVFYTGGAMRLSRDSSRSACACHDEVKVSNLIYYLIKDHSFRIRSITFLFFNALACAMHHFCCVLFLQVIDNSTGKVLQTIQGVRLKKFPESMGRVVMFYSLSVGHRTCHCSCLGSQGGIYARCVSVLAVEGIFDGKWYILKNFQGTYGCGYSCER